MPKYAIVATIKTAPGKREEYLKHLRAHAERCRSNEPGTLAFEILVPQEQADTIMLYELYKDRAAFDAHLNGASMQQARKDAAGLSLGMTAVRCDFVE
jgi:quinol monooxygenase YgiN